MLKIRAVLPQRLRKRREGLRPLRRFTYQPDTDSKSRMEPLDVVFSRIEMKTLLLIANNTGLAESVHNTAARAGTAVTQITSCRAMNEFLTHGCAYDMVIIELRPCLSRLALLAEIQERFRGLPVLAVVGSDDACEQALACAYSDCTPVRVADLDDASLARRLGCESAPALSTSLKQRRIP